jgi:hypothetical protein
MENSENECLSNLVKELKSKHPIFSGLLVDRINRSMAEVEEYINSEPKEHNVLSPTIWIELNQIVRKHLNP